MNGTAVYGEPVVVVEVDNGDVRLKTGRIVSNGSSHALADNRRRTVVWGDQEFRPTIEPLDEGHEKEFSVDNIHLLKAEEVKALQDPSNAFQRFGEIYQDWVIRKIQRALKHLKL